MLVRAGARASINPRASRLICDQPELWSVLQTVGAQGLNVTAVLVGLLAHQLGPSLLWGFVYGVVARAIAVRSMGAALALGLGVGVVSMVGPYVLIPFLMNALHGVDYWNREVPMGWDWAAHMVFGASFVLYPAISSAVAKGK